MKKVKQVKGCVIGYEKETKTYEVYTSEEWSYGNGMRYPEYDGIDTLDEAIELATYL